MQWPRTRFCCSFVRCSRVYRCHMIIIRTTTKSRNNFTVFRQYPIPNARPGGREEVSTRTVWVRFVSTAETTVIRTFVDHKNRNKTRMLFTLRVIVRKKRPLDRADKRDGGHPVSLHSHTSLGNYFILYERPGVYFLIKTTRSTTYY